MWQRFISVAYRSSGGAKDQSKRIGGLLVRLGNEMGLDVERCVRIPMSEPGSHHSDVNSRRQKARGDVVPQVMKTNAGHARSFAECRTMAVMRSSMSLSATTKVRRMTSALWLSPTRTRRCSGNTHGHTRPQRQKDTPAPRACLAPSSRPCWRPATGYGAVYGKRWYRRALTGLGTTNTRDGLRGVLV